MKEPNRGHKGPLHVKDLRGAGGPREMPHPEVNPDRKMGRVSPRKVTDKGCQKFTGRLKGLT